MDNDLKLLLLKFVNREVPMGEIRSWISENIWDTEPAVDDSIDQVAISLFHLDEGIINEVEFRRLMVKRLGLFHFVEHNEAAVYFLDATVFAAFATNAISQIGETTGGIPVGYAVTGKSEAVTSPRAFAFAA